MENLISAIDFRDYAIGLGWKLVSEALKDGLYVLNSPFEDFTQLIFPKDDSEANQSTMMVAIDRLALVTNKSRFQLVEEIREVRDDVLAIRYYSESKSVNSLSFEKALAAIDGTKQLILSAASTIIHPSTFHPRLSRNEPNELLKRMKFRHTAEGSFILKVSCPIEVEAPIINLFGESYVEPYARQTFSLMNQASAEVLNAIESNTEAELAENLRASTSPRISYNFCDALLDLFDDERELPFELQFHWSTHSKQLLAPPAMPPVRFLYSIKPKLETVKSYLKPFDKLVEDTFIGTVESLSGNLNSSDERAGEVKIAILVDLDIVTAKAILDSEQYRIADEAHMTPGAYIRIKGKLQPGKQLRAITDIVEFSRL